MRKMHIRAIDESGLTAADEMLYPENWRYLSDILSYVAIAGARSVEDQQHRLTVSGFDVPAGMKNPTSGDFSVMLNSVYAAQRPIPSSTGAGRSTPQAMSLRIPYCVAPPTSTAVIFPNYHYEGSEYASHPL